MNMGERLRQILEDRKLRQADLVEMVDGLDSKSLSAIIKRDSRFSEYALGISKALNLSLEFLIFGEDDPSAEMRNDGNNLPATANDTTQQNISADELCELVRIFCHSGPVARERILKAARFATDPNDADRIQPSSDNQRKRSNLA